MHTCVDDCLLVAGAANARDLDEKCGCYGDRIILTDTIMG